MLKIQNKFFNENAPLMNKKVVTAGILSIISGTLSGVLVPRQVSAGAVRDIEEQKSFVWNVDNLRDKRTLDVSKMTNDDIWAHLRRETGWVSRIQRERKQEAVKSPSSPAIKARYKRQNKDVPARIKKISAEKRKEHPDSQEGSGWTDTKLLQSIRDNREFFSRFNDRRDLFTSVLSDYANLLIYAVNSNLGEERIGVVFLSPAGIQETVVFDKTTGHVLYKDIKILKKNIRLSMMQRSVSAAEVCALAQISVKFVPDVAPDTSVFNILPEKAESPTRNAAATATATKKTQKKTEGLVQDIVVNREFFYRIEKQRNFPLDKNCRIFKINAKVGRDCIGIVFLSSSGKQEIMVFDKNTGRPIYKDVKKPEKKVYATMLKNSISVKDAFFIARNIASIRSQDTILQDEMRTSVTQPTEAAGERRGIEQSYERSVELETDSAGLQEEYADDREHSGMSEYVESQAPATNDVQKPPTGSVVTDENALERFKRETGWVSRIMRQKRKHEQQTQTERLATQE
jgi:hypothetical protein